MLLCLISQVFLCFGNSVASTRFLLQDEFNIQTTQCDNCIIVLSLSLSFPPSLPLPLMQLIYTCFLLFLGFHARPTTSCMHLFHRCNDCWKWWNSRGFSNIILFGGHGVLHVRLSFPSPTEFLIQLGLNNLLVI